MKHVIHIAAWTALSVMPALAAAQDVNYDFNRTKNFAHVNSFAIKQDTISSDNPLVDRRIIASIASTLSARGLRQVDRDPDVFVIPKMTVEMRKEVTAYNSGYWPPYGGYGYWGGGWGWGGGYWGGWGTTTLEERNLQYNTLVIDMVDAKSGDLMWRGSGVRRVHSHWKPDEVDKKVDKTVAKILSNYPPASSRMSP